MAGTKTTKTQIPRIGRPKDFNIGDKVLVTLRGGKEVEGKIIEYRICSPFSYPYVIRTGLGSNIKLIRRGVRHLKKLAA